MKELNLKLTEIFKTNSCKLYETKKQQATPAHDSLCYIWNDAKGLMRELISKNKTFRPGGSSRNNLIRLSDSVYETVQHYCIIIGPNTTTKTQTVRIIALSDGITRIVFSGWGSSQVLLWEGRSQDLLRYFRDHQKQIGEQ